MITSWKGKSYSVNLDTQPEDLFTIEKVDKQDVAIEEFLNQCKQSMSWQEGVIFYICMSII